MPTLDTTEFSSLFVSGENGEQDLVIESSEAPK